MCPLHPFLQGDGDHALADELTKLDGKCARLHGAFAYVSEGGVQLIQQALDTAVGSAGAVNWLVSFDYGITTVGGLDALGAIDNSVVRIPSAEQVLADDRLRPSSAFHPKFLWLTGDDHHSIWIGSANLTAAGLSSNREVSLGVSNVDSDGDLIGRIDRWWRNQWETATPLTTTLIERYAEARSRSGSEPLDSVREMDRPAPVDLHEARLFWTQVGYTQGGARNQMDVPARCGPFFFGEVIAFEEGVERTITLIHEGERHVDRKAKYHGNDMTRIYLPTRTHGQPLQDIGNREEWYAVFRRMDQGVFELQLLPPAEASLALESIRRQSRQLDQIDVAGERPLGWL